MGTRDEGLQFVSLIHRLRTLGFALGLWPVAAVLYRQQAPTWEWLLLAANALLWPHLAWQYARRGARPARRERFNLLADAAMLGGWIAAMHFALLPSVLLITMMCMDRVGAGGWRLLGKALPIGVAGCALVAWIAGATYQPGSGMLGLLACLPMLGIYPVWLSTVTFRQAQRIRHRNRLLEQLNHTDMLTGIANRAHWMDTAAREMHRYLRNQRPATLILLDIDGFKQVNDSRGHAAGDALLQQLATVLHESLRSVDTPGRLGGDEFGIVLPETDLEHAREVAERIRQRVERLGRADEALARPYTLSLGVAQIGPRHANVDAWVRQADVALYLAKAQGRNRVCTSSPEAVAP